MFAFELKPTQVSEDSAIKGLLTENYTNALKEYINSDVFPATFKGFSKESIQELIFWIKLWNKFCLLNSNQRVRILGRRMFFSGKIYFMRMSLVLSLLRNETEVQVETVKQACFDCVHFLLSTIQLYANKSVLTLSRDIWKTSDQKEAMFLEWLNYQGALSKDESSIGISQAQEMIGDIFGVNQRQSISIYSRLRKMGYIMDYKGQHDSRVWMGFNPNLEEFVDFGDRVDVNLPDALLRVKWELEQSEVREVQSVLENTIRADTTHTTTIYTNIDIVTPNVDCNSNNSKLIIPSKTIIEEVGTPPNSSTNYFLTKEDYELLDGTLGIGRCTSCGKSQQEIVAVNRSKRLAICEVCYEKLD